MKKPLMVFGGIVLAGVVACACLMLFWLGPAVKTTIESIGSKAVGTPVSIEKLRIYPVTGTMHLGGLVIGNPKGFTSDCALSLKNLEVDIAITSLLSDTIVIKDIVIDAPEFTYERRLKSDNITAIRDHIKAYTAKAETPQSPTTPDGGPEKSGKKVVIDRLVIRNGWVNAKISALPAAPIRLPDMETTDIGKNTGGTTWSVAAEEIFSFFDMAIMDVVSNAGHAAGGLIEDVGDAALGAGKSAGDAASDAVKGIGDLFRKK